MDFDSATFPLRPAWTEIDLGRLRNNLRLIRRDLPRHAATDVAAENKDEEQRQAAATPSDEERQAATDNRYVARLESENEFLRGQIAVKDKQIADQQERSRETNLLLNGLQRLLAPLLSAPVRDENRAAGE